MKKTGGIKRLLNAAALSRVTGEFNENSPGRGQGSFLDS